MHDKRFPKWRSWMAVALLLIVAAVIVVGWSRAPNETPAVNVPATDPTPLVPPSLQILDRAALIEAGAKAASAYAAGKSNSAAAMDLAGMRFELHLPLGCSGALSAEALVKNGWRYDAKTGVLQVAFPSSMQRMNDEFIRYGSKDATKVDLGKGFWIEREWLRDVVCPAEVMNSAMQMAAEAPTLAIAEIGDAQEPRAKGRDGTDYRVSKRIPVEEAPDQEGLRIVVSGRIASDGLMPIQCRSISKDRRPMCIILVRFDRIALTNARGSQTYGAWQD